jgi:ABC-type multidrug transport system fused ATPase/permease subunit
MIRLDKNSEEELIKLFESKNIGLEGNVIKLIESDNDEFKVYLTKCTDKDKDTRRKRLEITKKVQTQNNELSHLNEENLKIMEDLQSTLKEAEEQKVKIEAQNGELIDWREENEKIQQELQKEMIKSESARIRAEEAKTNAINDLDILQKKNQTELISTIVRVALYIIVGVGIVTTGVYVFTLVMGKDTQVISAAWSNIFGILLTNAFSIVGTIMGIKYATENKQ